MWSYLFSISCFDGFRFLILYWQGTHHWVAGLTRCVLGSGVVPKEHALLWLSQRMSHVRFVLAVRIADWESRRKINEYIKPLVNILSERSFSHALNSGEVYDDQGEHAEVQLLQLETPGETLTWMLRRNSEVTISTRRSSGFVPGLEFHVLAVRFPSFPFGCEDLARAWSRSRLS